MCTKKDKCIKTANVGNFRISISMRPSVFHKANKGKGSYDRKKEKSLDNE